MNRLTIKNFKCFKEETIIFDKLTVLTGSNGAGKSSIIQALLLLNNIVNNTNENDTVSISINQEPRLRLGSFENIVNDEHSTISLSLNEYEAILDLSSESQNDIVAVQTKGSKPSIFNSLYYLNAERIGPRIEEDIHKIDQTCGDRGELTGSLLMESHKIERNRTIKKDKENLQVAVDEWVSYICGDISFKPQMLSSKRYQMQVKKQGNKAQLATNTGFGYTYALPIVVDGLIAPRGSLLVVENPEAHLHPKAQSNMGFFLGKIAASGISVFVETHSEHIVNGLRRAALSRLEGLSPNDLYIYFLSTNGIDGEANQQPLCSKITMDSEGNLSDFPTDFFDQIRQDMLEIIRLGSLK